MLTALILLPMAALISFSVQSLSRVRLLVTPRTAALQASLSITNSWSLLKLMSIESVMPSNHLILCRPLLLPPPIFPSIRVFSLSQFFASGGQSIGVPASASVLPMNIQDWFPLELTGWIALQSKGLSRVFSNTTVQKHQFFWHSAFFIVQFSNPYMSTGKTTALTKLTFVDKVMSLLFNMLSRLVIAFLPWSKCLLISWLQSPSAVILEPKKVKSVTVSIASPSICHEVMGPDAMILVLWMLSFKPTFALSSFTLITYFLTYDTISCALLSQGVQTQYFQVLAIDLNWSGVVRFNGLPYYMPGHVWSHCGSFMWLL